eukprot:TRINITY_DN4465_c0_g4_i4.p1 TRINITY_DN4465_c0_g4~~TRINITY_DN4465_c0_g4_i4.p1  ORF type:complete len:462 (+),score=11.83 TRINITY_DN4465_c0_g4_i4:274-1659(+)
MALMDDFRSTEMREGGIQTSSSSPSATSGQSWRISAYAVLGGSGLAPTTEKRESFQGCCFKCGEVGHRRQDCKQQGKQRQVPQQVPAGSADVAQQAPVTGVPATGWCNLHHTNQHNSADCPTLAEGGASGEAIANVVVGNGLGKSSHRSSSSGGICGGKVLVALDSGTSTHMFDPETVSWDMAAVLGDYRPCVEPVKGIGGTIAPEGVASVDAHFKVAGGGETPLALRDVMVCRGVGINLLSMSKLEEQGVALVIAGHEATLQYGGHSLPLTRHNGLYYALLRCVATLGSGTTTPALAGTGPKSINLVQQLAGTGPKSISPSSTRAATAVTATTVTLIEPINLQIEGGQSPASSARQRTTQEQRATHPSAGRLRGHNKENHLMVRAAFWGTGKVPRNTRTPRTQRARWRLHRHGQRSSAEKATATRGGHSYHGGGAHRTQRFGKAGYRFGGFKDPDRIGRL